MSDVTVKEFISADQHVVILRRGDGIYSFRFIAKGDCRTEGMAGPYCGLYDSAETAETEARSRCSWLNENSN
jgi:hypothetical protein